ncbi:hypothetical protein AK812_SmicGene42087 [Symbiodinium microadriaticum]|uniref:Uncharacterized protein n=1 Tax=Symbiodinium microadriaticum TaxID=2951 RepID=A0A1Q9C4G5_SYMMI|nr:hypothetical protein AK812_SmicGene42087 [Symbiodinium microadriaticum]
MKDDGGDVGTMNANLPGGLLPSSSTKHAMDLLLFFEVHGVHGVKLHIVSLSVEFSGDGPSMLKLGSGNAGEEAAEILVSAMNGFVGGFLHKGLHFSDECIDISFGAGFKVSCSVAAQLSQQVENGLAAKLCKGGKAWLKSSERAFWQHDLGWGNAPHYSNATELVGQHLILVVDSAINVMFNFTDPLFKLALLAIVDGQGADPCGLLHLKLLLQISKLSLEFTDAMVRFCIRLRRLVAAASMSLCEYLTNKHHFGLCASNKEVCFLAVGYPPKPERQIQQQQAENQQQWLLLQDQERQLQQQQAENQKQRLQLQDQERQLQQQQAENQKQRLRLQDQERQLQDQQAQRTALEQQTAQMAQQAEDQAPAAPAVSHRQLGQIGKGGDLPSWRANEKAVVEAAGEEAEHFLDVPLGGDERRRERVVLLEFIDRHREGVRRRDGVRLVERDRRDDGHGGGGDVFVEFLNLAYAGG